MRYVTNPLALYEGASYTKRMNWLTEQFSNAGMLEYRVWYESLDKPFFAPEPWVFGAAWGFVYPLLAIAFIYTVYLFYKKQVSRGFLWLFALNIVLNLTFTAVALGTKNNALASLHILLVLGTLAWLELGAWKKSKVVFVLLLPYLLWGTFATTLQIVITIMN